MTDPQASPRTRRAGALLVAPPLALVAGAAVVVWWSVKVGRGLQWTQAGIKLGAAPLIGESALDGWDWRWSPALAAASAVAAIVVAVAVRRPTLGRWTLIAGAATASMTFTVALAATDGRKGLLRGADHETEYLANLAITPPAAQFVRSFLFRINDYSVHVRGHPPGFVLVLKLLDWLGLRGPWPVVGLSIVGTGATVAGVLVCVEQIAGARWMRRAAPWLVIAPYGIWMITSGDSFFAGVAAVGVALLTVAGARRGASAIGLGLIAGLLLGFLLFLTYLGATFGIIPAAVVIWSWRRHGPRALIGTGAAILGVVAIVWLFARAGFWWWDGVEGTKLQYAYGSAKFRPWSYFRWGNLGAAVFALGPATIIGLGVLRDRKAWLLVGAGVATIAVSHASTYTKAEVERIWILLFPWVAVAAAGLVSSRHRRWTTLALVAQAATTILLQAALVSKW